MFCCNKPTSKRFVFSSNFCHVLLSSFTVLHPVMAIKDVVILSAMYSWIVWIEFGSSYRRRDAGKNACNNENGEFDKSSEFSWSKGYVRFRHGFWQHFVDASFLSFGESARVYHAWGLQKAYILFHQWFWRRFQLPKRFGERFYTFSQQVLANSLLTFAKAFGETTCSLAL